MENYLELGINYCNSYTKYTRFKTREVKVGDLGIGGNNPIRIQSMTTTNTNDTIATVEQSIRMIDAGCELVRITAPSIKEAENLREIKEELNKRGYKVPLIADIHFTPNAAELAARIVEKVRINPGNYIDKKKFQKLDYTDAEYTEEIERIRERVTPLIKICKEYGTAMRIGSNHGSLSDRIMSRYGDSPLGMVESAMEFLRICEDENYYNIVLSMKASNPQVMIQAYRLLIMKMKSEGMNYPLHLGVTEAGDGLDARIKSSIGIGSLLEDGIGDTIRVSLTEDPEFEIPVAKRIVERYTKERTESFIIGVEKTDFTPLEYKKREVSQLMQFGGAFPPMVISDLSVLEKVSKDNLAGIGYEYNEKDDKWNVSRTASDFVYLNSEPAFAFPSNLKVITDFRVWNSLANNTNILPLYALEEFLESTVKSDILNFVKITLEELLSLESIDKFTKSILVLETTTANPYFEMRRAIFELQNWKIKIPVILKRSYSERDAEKFTVDSSTETGSLFIDGMGDGIWLKNDSLEVSLINQVMFGILQATRTRISKTEYIACPSCGRTLFNLQEVTARIKSKTEHLKGVKIAVMGCIVNGLGEMADADYGYIGSGVGKISLYRAKDLVKKGVEEGIAVDELIGIIKEDGKWVEP